MSTFANYFNNLEDPRSGNAIRHKFCDILSISLLCALCGGETATDMVDFGHAKEDFLREFLELPHGIPCHDTFSRVFRLMQPEAFTAFFEKFRQDVDQSLRAEGKQLQAIAIDGKVMRRSFDKASDQSALNVVTAFAHDTHLSLGIETGGKGGAEIIALRELVKRLDIRSKIITADALHCQRETCEIIVGQGGDYCLQLKGNQGDMQDDVRAIFADQDIDKIDEYTSTDADHGRIETRRVRVYEAPEYIQKTHNWPALSALVQLISTREINGQTTTATHAYLMSKTLSAEETAAIIRGHWQIENGLHWSLDVIMADDQHRARKDNAPINFAALRRIALNIIKANKEKGSNRIKFKRAGWNNDFLRSLVNDF